MPFNLMEEPWLPLRRRSGLLEWAPPWRISDRGGGGDDPFQTLDPTRADLRGALMQFLVGLLQTAWPPANKRAWLAAWEKPPSPETLRKAFQRLAPAFNLDGPGPRFMQVELPAGAKAEPVGLLLIDQPEPTKAKDNKAHFIKLGQVEGMCRACLAASLHTLQTFAPSGGRGHLTSLRGGGPLTTLILGDDLWQTLWLAVQPAHAFWPDTPPPDPLTPRVFPWLGQERASDSKPIRLTPLQADPAHVFWGMPRRIWLDLDEPTGQGPCPVCGRDDQELFSRYHSRPNGIKYEGGWRHPLSPYYETKEGPAAVKGQPGGLSYRHWLGLVVQDEKKKQKRLPAQVVRRFTRDWEYLAPGRDLAAGPGIRLWAHGYDMDNKKARSWVESEMPLVSCPAEVRDEFEALVRALVLSADNAARTLAACLKEAWFPPGSKVKSNQGALGTVSGQLYHFTEPAFYQALARMRDRLESRCDQTDPELVACKETWLKTLQDAALDLFRHYSQAQQVGQADPKRIARAHNKLKAYLSPRAKVQRETMELPALPKGTAAGGRGGRK